MAGPKKTNKIEIKRDVEEKEKKTKYEKRFD